MYFLVKLSFFCGWEVEACQLRSLRKKQTVQPYLSVRPFQNPTPPISPTLHYKRRGPREYDGLCHQHKSQPGRQWPRSWQEGANFSSAAEIGGGQEDAVALAAAHHRRGSHARPFQPRPHRRSAQPGETKLSTPVSPFSWNLSDTASFFLKHYQHIAGHLQHTVGVTKKQEVWSRLDFLLLSKKGCVLH